jgi:hypothetical protein
MHRTSTRSRRAACALIAVLALAGASCSRGDETESGSDTTGGGGSDTSAPTEGNRLDAGGFGDLENVCQDGEGGAADEPGLTADTIQVGTITDKGFVSRPGLNEEMYDTAVAFANWCNEHGGINGRELVIADRDAALTDFNARIIDACSQDFALVGGGAVLDDADNGGRAACGLPNIAGYVVSEAAREGELQVQPVPNPVGTLSFGAYQQIAELYPELIDRYGTVTSSFGSVLAVRDDTVAAAESLGYTEVYRDEYNSAGEPNWRPFVDEMQAADVQVLEFVGEPTFFGQLLLAMEEAGYRPQVMLQQTNFYDETFIENSGAIADNVYVRTSYTPLELAEENPATSDYLELMERYNPGGKVAQLGMQSLSAFLLFAQAAHACGADLTRTCLLEEAGSVSSWTAGGLHSPTDPAGQRPSACFVQLDVTADGFTVNEELTQPDEGIFNCEDDNVVTVPGA